MLISLSDKTVKNRFCGAKFPTKFLLMCCIAIALKSSAESGLSASKLAPNKS